MRVETVIIISNDNNSNSNDTDRKFLAYIIIRAPAIDIRWKKSLVGQMK